jgi:hypothetical protein
MSHVLAPGTQLGPYEIDSLIGAGGMGEVSFRVTPDGKSQAYTWHRALSNLYVADGLR